MTMYFAQKASLNKGVVGILWSINPLFIAIYDKIVFKQSLSTRHAFGSLTFILSILSIGFSSKLEPSEFLNVQVGSVVFEVVSSWIPVVMSVITPIGFATNAILIRLMVIDLNFDIDTT